MIEIQVNGLVKSFEVGRNVLDGLYTQRDAEKNKLKRLYTLYAAGDDALIEAIEDQRKSIARIEKSIEAEEEKVKSSELPSSKTKNISTILDAWSIMNYEERRAAVLKWINAVVVDDGKITVDFKF